ncbi:YcdB/YcdC domain-containing protein [Cohnella cholangitidis]|uniref:Uncharacterized protein n=1 Tax=Cohnella cholangitidis TaxID=2598458 RepID=A0A7G5C1W4_9BACL|nr:YcdB/YcdC domain-containing protein [Cohnella cholangitidis]QMV43198.1 hypothetical protein FPL14_19930 [Cohnella cholangitidis]
MPKLRLSKKRIDPSFAELPYDLLSVTWEAWPVRAFLLLSAVVKFNSRKPPTVQWRVSGIYRYAFSLLVSLSLCIGSAASAFGEPKPDPAIAVFSQESAMEKVVQLLPDVRSLKPSLSELTYRSDDIARLTVPVWHFVWTKGAGAHPTQLHVNVDAMTMDLLDVHWRSWDGTPNVDSSYPAKINREQAMGISKKFILEALPSLKGAGLRVVPWNMEDTEPISPLFGSARYSFSFAVIINGYPIYNTRVHVSLDGSGDVKGFYFTGDPGTFAPVDIKLSSSEAHARWSEQLSLRLNYTNFNPFFFDSNSDWNLAYEIQTLSEAIDAKNGSPISTYRFKGGDPLEMRSVTSDSMPFVKHTVSKQQAIFEIEAYAEIPDNMEWTGFNRSDIDPSSPNLWVLRGENRDEPESRGVEAEVNADTGQIYSFTTHADVLFHGLTEEQKSALPKITASEALVIADRWMVAHVEDFSARYKRGILLEADDDWGYYIRIKYIMFYRGIPVNNQDMTITLNGNGKVVEYEGQMKSPTISELALLKNEISAEQAKQKLLDDFELEPMYASDDPGAKVTKDGQYVRPESYVQFIPVDRMKYSGYLFALDAGTGQRISMNGILTPVIGGTLPTNIASHKSSKAMQMLLDHGVIFLDQQGKLNPNRTVARGEFLRMVRLAVQPLFPTGPRMDNPAFTDIDVHSPYSGDIQFFIKRKWLQPAPETKFQTDIPLTREQLAIWITAITGGEKVASQLSRAASVNKLKDNKSLTNRGAVAFALKYGFMTAHKGEFKPLSKVTLAEVSEVLVKLAEKQQKMDYSLLETGN